MTGNDRQRDKIILQAFCDEGWITEVISEVKSGKEARVYCCRAASKSKTDFVAAKIYQPLERRSFKNDRVYQVGRVIREFPGGLPDSRARRAFQNKSKVGRNMQFTGWLRQEWETLNLLHAAGAAVPRPVIAGPCGEDSEPLAPRAILMDFIGRGSEAAPKLKDVKLAPEDARRTIHCLLKNVALWLAYDRIHGDLSPYNILYTSGNPVVIDFPQAIDPRSNPAAFSLLQRDIENTYRYFADYGYPTNPFRLARELWGMYRRADPQLRQWEGEFSGACTGHFARLGKCSS